MKTKRLLLLATTAIAFTACNSGIENDHDRDSITVDTVITTADSVIVDPTDTIEPADALSDTL